MIRTRRDAPLTGSRLGTYDVRELIGAGAMGDVYRARDSRLGREVAIKVLPEVFTGSPERLARFEREARILAALNHPHIAAIYGIEQDGSVRALVLELAEGETLAERLLSGKVPVAEALTIARQLADALDAAHEKGIVHRDLKPANIKITPAGAVKVLDFGLARTSSATTAACIDDPRSSTITIGGTREGRIAGTVAYMSPEQARGKPVDERTDIWAFGCVLYELLTGRRAFAGETVTDILAAVLQREPDWRAVPKRTPSGIRRLLRRCLEKDAARRLRDIAHARVEIDQALAPRLQPRPAAAALAALSCSLLISIAAVVWHSGTRRPLDRTDWEQLTNLDFATQPALSPDGRMLAFIRGPGTFTTTGQIYVKLLPDGEPVALTDDGLTKMHPVFSPDGARVAYTVRDVQDAWDTWIVPTLRGEPRRWLQNASGLTWTGRRELLYSQIKAGIHMAIVTSPETAGASRDLYVPASRVGMAHRAYASPDARWVLVVEMDRGRWTPCRLLGISGDPAGRLVGPRGACTGAAWSSDGRWMYFNADAGDGVHIWRQRFPDGESEQLTFGPTEEEGLAVAPDGTFLVTSVGLRQRSVWIRDSRGERQVSLEGTAAAPRLSADGRHAVFRVAKAIDLERSPTELWVANAASGRSEPLLPGLTVTGFDLSLDGRFAAAVLQDDGKPRVWRGWIDRRSPPEPVPGAYGDMPMFGAQGELFFLTAAADGDSALIRRRGDSEERVVLGSFRCTDVSPAISPDGRFFAVSEYPPTGGMRLMVYPLDGGAPKMVYDSRARLRWSRDGRHAYISVSQSDIGSFALGRTYVLPVPAGSMLPRLPPGGFRSEAELAAAPGVQQLPIADLGPGGSVETYAFSRVTVARNLYRIPLR